MVEGVRQDRLPHDFDEWFRLIVRQCEVRLTFPDANGIPLPSIIYQAKRGKTDFQESLLAVRHCNTGTKLHLIMNDDIFGITS